MDEGYAIGEVAAMAHTSVRTLHYYDAIGLVIPSARTAAGHRRYAADDLARLREALFYRELDFGLDEIAQLLADPDPGIEERLRRQHHLLRGRIARHQRLLTALEKEMEARAMGISLTPEEQFEILGSDAYGGAYADEAEQRWGDTPAWTQSARRTAAYTRNDWILIKAETLANVAAFAAAMRAGEPVDGATAMDLAEQHRRQIDARYYECSPAFHRTLAQLYVEDDRFRATYDEVARGLAQYVHDAILANADRHAG